MTRGERVIAFIERYCRTPEGDHIGNPIVLEPFQRKFILEVYDNPFGTRRGYLSIARKNGKTALIAGIVLAHIVGPEARMNSQIVSGAQSKEQAAIVYDLAAKMIGFSHQLREMTRLVPNKKWIFGLRRNVHYRALSADGKTAHGASPVLAILDEVGQVEGPTDKFISAITTSQGAYQDALLLAISTQAEKDTDMFSVWIDRQASAPNPRIVSHIYTAPAECKLDDRAAWFAANPALGKFKSITDLEDESALAIQMPTNEPEFRNLSLNQRVSSTTPFVPAAVWKENGGAPGSVDGKKVYGGLDLSSVNDLTALVLVDADGGVHPTFWLPKVGLLEKGEREHVPYAMWEKDGHLHTTPGNAIEYEFVAAFLRGVFDRCDVQAIGFDRALMKFLTPWLVKAGFTEAELAKFKEFGQGTLSMTPALRELEVKLLNRKLKHGSHPVMNMCAANVRVVGDSGARKFDKHKSRGRIDGMTALANAIGVMPSDAPPPPPKFQMFMLGNKQ